MKIYKDQDTELLYVGTTTYPAGSLQLEILSDNKIRLINLLSKTNDPIFSGNVTDIINKENKSYDNLTDFINKCKDFFVNASSNGEAFNELESKVDETIVEIGALEDRVNNLGVEANLEPLTTEVAQLRSDLNEIKDLTTIYNVTQNVPLESGYYTLATATAAAEGKGVNKDGKGIVLTYAVSDIKWESFQFTGTATDSATWNMLSLWKEFGGAGNVKTISVNDGEASFPDSEGNANIIVPITEIDEALDSQSTNPVQNKVIKEALAQMDTRFAAGMDIDTETNILSLLDAVGNVLGTAQLPSGGGGTTAPGEEVDGSTLGGLTNVNNEVDVQDAQDVFLVKSAGSDEWGKRNVKDFTGKDGVIAYPTMFLNPLTGRLILQVPTNNYENRFAVRNGHLMLIQ